LNRKERLHQALGRVPATRAEIEEYSKDIQKVADALSSQIDSLFVEFDEKIKRANNYDKDISSFESRLYNLEQNCSYLMNVVADLQSTVNALKPMVEYNNRKLRSICEENDSLFGDQI
jgi:septal ring factor EnvC (AmiA/AmiB activator)